MEKLAATLGMFINEIADINVLWHKTQTAGKMCYLLQYFKDVSRHQGLFTRAGTVSLSRRSENK